MPNTERVRALNDAFRTTLQGGKIMLTSSVSELPEATRGHLLRGVMTFDAFDLANDPYGEHDFGGVDIDGEHYLFKLDYYDTSLTYGSEDPADPEKTTRVLTIMRADEY